MRSIKRWFIMFMILGVCITTIAMAGYSNGYYSNDTNVTTNATSTPTVTQTVVTQPTQTQVPTTVATTEKEKKFRSGPTVRIRPLNDEIKKNQDGLVELYMDNPSLNDVTLTVDARISVPSGIHVYGQGFGEAAAAGMVYGKFELPPGSARTINIVIKAEKTGDFSTQFTGTYYPDDNKDAYQPISLTHPFKVLEASKDPNTPGEGTTTVPTSVPKSPGMSAILAIFAIVILAHRNNKL